jgi:hypothetical protein
MTAPTFTLLDDSYGEIDTADQLTAASAFQKVFIANGANLKVADFINIKISTEDIGDNPPDPGTILTGETSAASMIVDYIDAVTGACNVYGYRTTDETFTTEVVAGTDNDDNAISFTTSGAEASGPLWYAWTVFGNDADTYGTMPNKAYLVAVYRGRVVLSGNPEYPNQWYMTRLASPFDFLYGSDDPMSAVAGNNADAGQCPDMVTALISFHDDYLIFGGVSSLWILRGDPVAGGSLDNLTDVTGIFGDSSWCFDDDRNLYFWGNGGIYRILANFSGVQNLTELALPTLVIDEAPNPSTHRITMGYDKHRHGLVICITTLADGSNSNYFYSLQIEGFYPETYPEECGAFSLLYYPANDKDYADLLIGSADGYVRRFVDEAKDDDVGATDETISSYVTFPIMPLADGDEEGKITELTFDSAGGASGGAFGDSDAFSWEIHVGDDAETVLEDIQDGATAKFSGTVTGSGRQNKVRSRMRGVYAGLKIYNSTATSTWAVNNVKFKARAAGSL